MRLMGGRSDEKEPDPRDRGDDTPETPPDEPQPAPVQDPPVEPVEPPYVVVHGFPDRHAGALTKL